MSVLQPSLLVATWNWLNMLSQAHIFCASRYPQRQLYITERSMECIAELPLFPKSRPSRQKLITPRARWWRIMKLNFTYVHTLWNNSSTQGGSHAFPLFAACSKGNLPLCNCLNEIILVHTSPHYFTIKSISFQWVQQSCLHNAKLDR